MIQGQDSITREERMDRLNEPDLTGMFLFQQKDELRRKGWKERNGHWYMPGNCEPFDLETAMNLEYNLAGLDRVIQCIAKNCNPKQP